jgi:membrane protein implicated in regulation of membrane protease activity
MPNSADALRRWWGAFCLAVAAGMLIWGQTVLVPYLHGIGFLIYWACCFTFTIGAILFALLDVRAVRRRVRDEQANLIQRTIEDIERGKEQQHKPE